MTKEELRNVWRCFSTLSDAQDICEYDFTSEKVIQIINDAKEHLLKEMYREEELLGIVVGEETLKNLKEAIKSLEK